MIHLLHDMRVLSKTVENPLCPTLVKIISTPASRQKRLCDDVISLLSDTLKGDCSFFVCVSTLDPCHGGIFSFPFDGHLSQNF